MVCHVVTSWRAYVTIHKKDLLTDGLTKVGIELLKILKTWFLGSFNFCQPCEWMEYISLREWEQAWFTSKKSFAQNCKTHPKSKSWHVVSLEWSRKVEMGRKAAAKIFTKFPNWRRHCILAGPTRGNKTSGEQKNLFSENLYWEIKLWQIMDGFKFEFS